MISPCLKTIGFSPVHKTTVEAVPFGGILSIGLIILILSPKILIASS